MTTETETTTQHSKETRRQCRHVLVSGHRCQSPALRSARPGEHEPFCYFHHTTRRPVPHRHSNRLQAPQPTQTMDHSGGPIPFVLPHIEDLSSIQAVVNEIILRITLGDLDARRAGLIIYAVQTATSALRASAASSQPTRNSSRNNNISQQPEVPTVDQVIDDPDLGLIAPIALYIDPEDNDSHPRTFRNLLHELDVSKARREAQRKAQEEIDQQARQQAEQSEPAAVDVPIEPTILPTLEARAEDHAPVSRSGEERKPLIRHHKTNKIALRGRRPLRGAWIASRGASVGREQILHQSPAIPPNPPAIPPTPTVIPSPQPSSLPPTVIPTEAVDSFIVHGAVEGPPHWPFSTHKACVDQRENPAKRSRGTKCPPRAQRARPAGQAFPIP